MRCAAARIPFAAARLRAGSTTAIRPGLRRPGAVSAATAPPVPCRRPAPKLQSGSRRLRPPMPLSPGQIAPTQESTGPCGPNTRRWSPRCRRKISRKLARAKNCRRSFAGDWSITRPREPAGTIVIDTPNTYLYLVLGNGKAIRYGIGVGREGFTWAGTEQISKMAEWPDWNPPAEMIERQPYLPRFMAGGEGNPLGARALYLGSIAISHSRNQPALDHRHVRVIGLHSAHQPRRRRPLRPRPDRHARRGVARRQAAGHRHHQPAGHRIGDAAGQFAGCAAATADLGTLNDLPRSNSCRSQQPELLRPALGRREVLTESLVRVLLRPSFSQAASKRRPIIQAIGPAPFMRSPQLES